MNKEILNCQQCKHFKVCESFQAVDILNHLLYDCNDLAEICKYYNKDCGYEVLKNKENNG